MKKIVYLLSCVALLITGCNGSGKKSNELVNPVNDVKRYSFTGTHEFDVKETENYIVRNKKTDYKILIPRNADSYIYTAKEELTNLFKEATGIILDTEVETVAIDHNPNLEYISIGDTDLFLSSGLEIDKSALGVQAVRIQTLDKCIYLNGGDTTGCLFAVYDLLEVLFDFDAYSYDCINLTKKEEVKFYSLNITDIPDISMRANSWGFIKENPNNIANRLRTPADFSAYFIETADTEKKQTRSTIHNSLDIVPPSVYMEGHPKWFSTNGKDPITQVCYTCRGDEQEYNALLDHSASIIEKDLKHFDPISYPLKNTVTFTMEDNTEICGCDACKAAKAKYGADVGAVMVFCNNLMERIHNWMEENPQYAREDFKLLFFAYSSFIDCPAHYDEKVGKYVVNHEDLVLRDDVGVYYAISSGIQYQLDIYDKQNQEGIVNYNKWIDVSPSLYLWTYNANFGEYLSHVNSTNFYNNNAYQFFAANKAVLLYNQGGWNTYNLTAFQMLAIYLDAKLSWDSNADMAKLIDNWFKGMYKDGAEEMRKLYEEENAYAVILAGQKGFLQSSGIINKALRTAECWPFQLLQRWLGYIKNARSKIAIYERVDPSLHKVLKEHMDLEWVSPAYFMMSIWGRNYLTDEEYNGMEEYFKSEILPLKGFLTAERSGTLTTLK